MAVYEPEPKWAYWEDEPNPRGKTHEKIQRRLKEAGYYGIPCSSGGGGQAAEGVTIFLREDEYGLSRTWYEQGELFGEIASDHYDNWELWGHGEDSSKGAFDASEFAAQDLLSKIEQFLTEGVNVAKRQTLEQQRALERSHRRIEHLKQQLKDL